MELLEDISFKLIGEYEKHPLLWQAKHAQDYNKFKKQDAWEEIAEKVNADTDECKKKIASLLLSFRCEISKIKKAEERGRFLYKKACF